MQKSRKSICNLGSSLVVLSPVISHRMISKPLPVMDEKKCSCGRIEM